MLPAGPPSADDPAAAQGRIGFIAPVMRHRDEPVAAVGLRVEGSMAAWRGELALWQLGLARPPVREWHARGAIAHTLAPGWPAFGVGAWLRGAQSAERPWLGGIEAMQTGHWQLGRALVVGGLADWGVGLRTGWTIPGLGVTSTRFEVQLTRAHGPLRLGLGYRRWWLSGEAFEGPFLSVSLDDRAWREGAP